jgi:hypothetical protein
MVLNDLYVIVEFQVPHEASAPKLTSLTLTVPTGQQSHLISESLTMSSVSGFKEKMKWLNQSSVVPWHQAVLEIRWLH